MRRVRILLADEATEFLDSAAHFLSLEPRVETVGRARSGPEAVEQAARLQPDLVLLNLTLPGLNSLETTRRLKSHPTPPRVVLLTVYDQAEYRQILGKGPADGVLAKSRFGSDLFPLLNELFCLADLLEPPQPCS